MLTRVTATEFIKPMNNGKTGPLLVGCETSTRDMIEVVAKFSAGCEQGEANLAREVIAACLAGDLGLPVPEPFLVDVSTEWTATLPDPGLRLKADRSSPVAFGSKLMTGQFAVWGTATRISEGMLPTAASIFVFDAIIQNPDRRVANPNCLVRGDEVRIFDHEFAFSHRLVLGWKPPWELGGLSVIGMPGSHAFYAGLRHRQIDYAPIRAAWAGLSDAGLASYEGAVPDEWAQGAGQTVRDAIELVRDARDRIDGCLAEVQRVLR